MNISEVLAEEFFNAPHSKVSTHEEWLLRLYSDMMKKEAELISMIEEEGRKRQKRWKPHSYQNSEAFTTHSVEKVQEHSTQ